MFALRTLSFPTIVALLCLSLNLAAAAEDDPLSDRETAALRAAARDYAAAVRRADIDAMLQMWTTKGDDVNAAGQVFRAHDLIRQQLGKPRPNDERKDVAPADSSLRFIAPRLVWISAALICPGHDCRSTNYPL
jgi:hypothetical protein